MPPTMQKGAISVAFVCLSVCPSVAYIASNLITEKPSMPKFGMKLPHLRCDSHTSFEVKWSKVSVRGGRGHTMSAKPGGHTACLHLSCSLKETKWSKNDLAKTILAV